ncbi:hypothetical protein FBALC1_06023 [Flavobacteriales bacterium ALC-1]|nr:hypothetical protein FBALC1_06023 [Flavobacteriales bacterium ALC-1]
MVLRKSIVSTLCILTFSFSLSKLYSQKLHLELKSIVTNKVRKIYKNDLVVVHTEYKKYKGLIKIIDKQSISLNGRKIKIDDIIKIKKIKVDFKPDKK